MATALLTVLLLGCGEDDVTGSNSKTLRVGRYSYVAYDGESADFTGTLTITFATADSVAGTWNVPAYEPTVNLGFYNLDAYVLWAQHRTASALDYTHRVARNGNVVTCIGKIAMGPSFPCQVSYLGP